MRLKGKTPSTSERGMFAIRAVGIAIGLLVGNGSACGQPRIDLQASLTNLPAPVQDGWLAVTQLSKGAAIRVDVGQNRFTEGRLLSADDRGLRLQTKKQVLDIGRDSVRRVSVIESRTKHGALTGLLLGAAFGAVLGTTTVDNYSGGFAAGLAAGWGGIGAAIGALDGRGRKRLKIVYKRTP